MLEGLFTGPSTNLEWTVGFIFILLISGVVPVVWKIMGLLAGIHDKLMDIQDSMKNYDQKLENIDESLLLIRGKGKGLLDK